MHVDRCVCHGKTFARLRRVAESTGAATVEALQEHEPFGRGCGLCKPYVRRMLRTGETVFYEIVTEADEPAGPAHDGRTCDASAHTREGRATPSSGD